MANGTEKPKRVLADTETYAEEGYASHSWKINAALEA
jgi:hypothetical protein